MTKPRTLIAYVTRSGNTRAIAEALSQTVASDLVEIRPTQPYPDDYDEHVAQSRLERDSGFATPLASEILNIADYDEVFLGFPVWAGTVPSPIRTFLKTHDLRGKTLRPFITHGGYGVGDSPALIAQHAPGLQIAEPVVVNTDQEWSLPDIIKNWR